MGIFPYLFTYRKIKAKSQQSLQNTHSHYSDEVQHQQHFFLHPTHVVHWKNAFYRDSVSWDARLEAQERESLNARENSVVNHMACIRCKRKMLQKSTLPIPSCTRSRRTDRTMGIGLIAWFEIFFHTPSSPPSSPKKLPELSYRTWDSKWNTPQS